MGDLPSTGGTRREDPRKYFPAAPKAGKRLGPSRLKIAVLAAVVIVAIIIASTIIVDIYGQGLPSTGGERTEEPLVPGFTPPEIEGNDTGGNMTSGLDGNMTGRNDTRPFVVDGIALPATGGDRLESAN